MLADHCSHSSRKVIAVFRLTPPTHPAKHRVQPPGPRKAPAETVSAATPAASIASCLAAAMLVVVSLFIPLDMRPCLQASTVNR